MLNREHSTFTKQIPLIESIFPLNMRYFKTFFNTIEIMRYKISNSFYRFENSFKSFISITKVRYDFEYTHNYLNIV